MIYRPIAPRQLWDSWLFPWEGRFHLFHLETYEAKFDHIGRAVSDDLIHWTTLPSIPTKGRKGEWNHYGALTGCVVRHDNRFHLLLGSIPGDEEVVGVFISDDLENWRPYAGNPVMGPRMPHYLAERSKAPYWPVDWRDPSVVFSERDQHYHAVLCARRPGWGADDTGATLAHVRSKDLLHWEHLPPLATPNRFFHTEVPDWFEFEGRWYITFNTLSLGGIQIHTAGRESLTGTFYLIADKFDGPYRLADDPFLTGAGMGRQSSYSARTIPYKSGRVVYCHLNGKRPAWAMPKILRAGADGHLWLEYLPALEKLETVVLCGSVKGVPRQREGLGHWHFDDHCITASACAIGISHCVASDVGDLHFECRLTASSAARAGVMLRADPAGNGIAVLLDYEHQRIQIASATGHDVIKNSIGPFASWQCTAFDSCRWKLARNREYHLRCFARDEFVEVYLDDRWMLTASPLLPPVACEMPQTGRVDLYIERGAATFGDVRLAGIKPLA